MKTRTRLFSTLFAGSAASGLIFSGMASRAQESAPASPVAPAAENEDDYSISEEEVSSVSDVFVAELDEEREHGEVPSMFRDDSQLDDSHINQELGVNIYTAPSISKIFTQLDGLPTIPDEYVLRQRKEQLSTQPGQLALEMGFLLADGFIAVRSGRMNDIKPIALDLSRYGKAMGVGERMNIHSASLLEQAEKGLLEQFKSTLAATQADVNAELIALKDPDQAHLIALGGWVRALTASAAALVANFDEEQAKPLFYPDAPAYFSEILEGVNPVTAKSLQVEQMRGLLEELVVSMMLSKGEKPSLGKVEFILTQAKKLSTLCAH